MIAIDALQFTNYPATSSSITYDLDSASSRLKRLRHVRLKHANYARSALKSIVSRVNVTHSRERNKTTTH